MDRREVNLILRQYKTETGEANYPVLFSVPTSERIVEMAKRDIKRTTALLVGALTMAFESMNVKRGMNAIQILDLADYLIDSAAEDNLSFEDLVLFLQRMVTGKYELSYESMDIPKFMKTFEIYRQERHNAILELRENQHLQFRGLGYTERSTKEDALSEHFARFGETLGTLRENIRELKQQNK